MTVQPTANLYPMRLVTKMTGLSADTIRAWERRHGAVTPVRTEGNTRRYSSTEVRRLLLLREATRRGHSIGSIANLGARALERLLAADQPGLDVMVGHVPASPRTIEEIRQAYVGALCRYDGRSGLDLLTRCASRMDRRQLVADLLVPVWREVDARWSVASVGTSHRNLLVHHLHALAGTLARQAGIASGEETRVILVAEARSTPEMVALMASIVLSRGRIEPVYAGAELRRAEVQWALEMSQSAGLVYSGAAETDLGPSLSGVPCHVLDPVDPDWDALEGWAAPVSAGWSDRNEAR